MSMGAGEKEETSGFFPYFMLLSIVCITAYLVFHNKQKVCATFSQMFKIILLASVSVPDPN
jgi:hypothetical protein